MFLSFVFLAITILGCLVIWIRHLGKKKAANNKILELVLKGSKVGIWNWSLKTDKVTRSCNYGQLFGYVDSLGDKPLFEADLIHGEDVIKLKAALMDLIQGRTQEYEAEYRLKTKLGDWEWVLDRGVVVEHNRKGHPTRIAGITIDISKQKNTEEKLKSLSYTDPLTGLHNRAFFDKELRRLNQEDYLPLSVVIGDLNGLKFANDTFGHKEGDRLLICVADVLRRTFRKNDVITRWGGDEFAVLLPHTSKETAFKICERINQIFGSIECDYPQPSISLGVATRESLAESLDKILELAEEHMYQRKSLVSKENCHYLSQELLKTLTLKCDESCEHYRKIKALILEIEKALN